MLDTPNNLQILFTGINAQLTSAYQKAEPWFQKICTVTTSKTERELLNWMLTIPTLRQWLGPRFLHTSQLKSYELVNKPFELTLSMDAFKIRDDQYGAYSLQAQEAGMQAAKWPDYQVVAEIESNPTLPWTETTFFSSTNPTFDDADSTFDNNFSLALTPDNYQTVRSSMMRYKGADGKPIGVRPNLLVVPPALELQARLILNASFIAPTTFGGSTQVGANTNVLQGTSDLLVIPELTNDTRWYMLDTTRAIKPFIWQLREAPAIVWRNSPTDPQVFDLHQYLLGVEARGAAGFSLPFLAARSTG